MVLWRKTDKSWNGVEKERRTHYTTGERFGEPSHADTQVKGWFTGQCTIADGKDAQADNRTVAEESM